MPSIGFVLSLLKKCVRTVLLGLEMSVGHNRKVSVGCWLGEPGRNFHKPSKIPSVFLLLSPRVPNTFLTGTGPPTPTKPSLETGKQSWRWKVPKSWQQICSRWGKEAWEPEPFSSWSAETESGCGSVWGGAGRAWNTPEILKPNSSPVEKRF